MRLRLVDCQDSFTWNLVDLFAREACEVEVLSAHDPVDRLAESGPEAWILSPGPGRPRDWPALFALLEILPDDAPILGVCLGHQALGEFHGARLRKERPVHGESVDLIATGGRFFESFEDSFEGMRYNSLGLDPDSRPDCLDWILRGPEGEVMALEHKVLPRFGLQFHPDSILTPGGFLMARRFLEIARGFKAGNGKPLDLDSKTPCAHSSAG